MADERDPQVSQRYRELGAEEPPRALDEAILAASRRAVSGEMRSRLAPLVGPGGRRRWYFPVAAAAVITLAVAVTVQVERQRPDDSVVASAPPQPRMEERAAQAEKKEQAFSGPAAEQPAPAQKPAMRPAPVNPAGRQANAMRDLAKSTEQAAGAAGARERQVPAEVQARSDAARDNAAPAPAAPPVVAQAAPAPAPEPARREMESPRPQAGVSAEARVAAQVQRKAETPEASLERIAELRRQGRHEEADKALEEFRKRHPDYRLSDEMKAKIERKNSGTEP